MSLELVLDGIHLIGALTFGILELVDIKSGITDVQTPENLSPEQKKELITIRMELAKILVSVWKHAANADKTLQKEEENYMNKMIDSFFSETSFFTEQFSNHTEIKSELKETFNNPLTLDDIKKYSEKHFDVSLKLYDCACCLIAQKDDLADSEKEFLANFAKTLNISHDDKEKTESIHLSTINRFYNRKWF
ncbi:MAG: hypothetical protein SFU98_13980 [Leptospiraceae bacterium]|nr:hypothetical protein [Leptospiraceae bacterium]